MGYCLQQDSLGPCPGAEAASWGCVPTPWRGRLASSSFGVGGDEAPGPKYGAKISLMIGVWRVKGTQLGGLGQELGFQEAGGLSFIKQHKRKLLLGEVTSCCVSTSSGHGASHQVQRSEKEDKDENGEKKRKKLKDSMTNLGKQMNTTCLCKC